MAAAASVHDYVMYDYVTQLQAATQRVSADGLRCLRRLVQDLEGYVGEAFSNSEAILTPPPACFLPEPEERDRMLHVNFGILWSSMKCQEADAGSVAAGGSSVASGATGAAEAVGRGQEQPCSSPGKHRVAPAADGAAALQSPPKRPRTLFHEAEAPARPPAADAPAAHREAAPGPTKAGREAVSAKEDSASVAKAGDKTSEKAPDRIARQGPLAAPSPCRAQRQGLMASSPPRAPPPEQPEGEARRPGWGLRLDEAADDTPAAPAAPAAVPVRSFAAPASFAMPSTRVAVAEECLSPATPLDFAASNAWQGSALFAPPPPSPAPEPGGQAPPAPLPPAPALPPLPIPAVPVPALQEPAAQQQQQLQQQQQQQQQAGEGTPVPVSQRIMMFETRSTPCLRQPSAPHAAPSSGQSRLRNGVAAGSNGQLVNGNSMFTPLRASGCGVKPKELFRSHSEFARGAKQAPPAPRPARPPAAAAAAAGAGVSGPAPIDKSSEASVRACDRVEAFERLAAGSKREDVARPKSLKAAEMAKLQEERKLRDKQERERTRGLGTSASASTLGALGAGGTAATASSAPASARRPQPPAPPSADREAAGGRSVAAKPQEEPPAFSPQASPAAAPAGSAQRAVHFPPVPSFGPEPYVLLRQLDLPPKRDEDNYAISDHEPDSEEDEQRKSPDRSLKYVPKWCESYLEELKAQADMDPDTLFASRVPRCDLDAIFTDELYKEVGKNRPKRTRGSSGDWRKDRLTCFEIKSYKSRMGHVRSWEAEKAAQEGGL